jgi:pimeloyl-ACP methyl ester carboxylesterase
MESFRASDGRRLAYADSGGGGPAVLCLAGLSRNSRDFADLAEHLAPRFRVIRLDSRGRGRSEYAEDPMTEYAVPVEAGDAIELMNHLRLDRVALIGTSRGGILSMAIAGSNPDRISVVILNDVGAVVEGRGLVKILKALGRPPEARNFAEAARHLRAVNRREFADVPLEEWERHAHRIYDDEGGRPVLAYDPRLRLAVADAIDSKEKAVYLWPLFEALKELPLLVIRAANSDILSVGTIAAMQATHPGLVAINLPNRGHPPFLNEPAAVRAIDIFLTRFT